MASFIISSEGTGPIEAKLYVEPYWAAETNLFKWSSHLTNMAAMPVDRKTFRNLLL